MIDSDAAAEFSADRIKHMEMVQAVVARLGGSGFVVKGWAITVAGPFQGFGKNSLLQRCTGRCSYCV